MAEDHPRSEAIAVTLEERGERLDRLLAARLADLSRSRLKSLIVEGQVAVDGGTIRDPAYRVNAGERIVLAVPAPQPAEPQGEEIPLAVVYEDAQVIVIDKPAGLVVHPAAGNWTGTLVNALIAHCGASLSGVGGVRRPGIVHRLDKDTTGLMVVAKTDRAHHALAAQFADHGRTGPLQRSYLAFVWGVPDRPKGVVAAPIERHPHARDRMAVRPAARIRKSGGAAGAGEAEGAEEPEAGGRAAVTHWQVLERYAGADGKPVASLLECRLETGRTHQIRVHMAHIGHPLLGDATYGAGFKTKAAQLTPAAREALAALHRQALHACLLGFAHPQTGEELVFRSPLPADLAALRNTLLATAAPL